MKTEAFIQSLEEIGRHVRGEVVLETVKVVPPPINIKEVRSDLNLTQEDFASKFGLTLGAVRNWEQGIRSPEGPARVLLALIQKNPQFIEKELQEISRSQIRSV